jgi:hypothetical protein
MRIWAARIWMMIWVSKWKSSLLASKGILFRRLDRVDPVARVKLGQVHVQEGVLEAGEDLVAQVLVERHAAAAGAPGSSMREPKHGVASPSRTAGSRLDMASGAYWPSPCSRHHEVEPEVDGVAVAQLLVAAVTAVLGVAEHLQVRACPAPAGSPCRPGRCRRWRRRRRTQISAAAAQVLGDAVEDARQGRHALYATM